MIMQQLLDKGPLLDENGNLCQAGYAFQLVKDYKRQAIKAKKSRIKEWDYYYLGSKEYGIALTIDDNSYMSMASISFLDFLKRKQITKSLIKPFSNGKLNFPSDSKTGDIIYKGKGFSMEFLHEGNFRHLICSMDKFDGKDAFKCDVMIKENNTDTMVIATPFDKDRHFYYNQKINNLSSTGLFYIGKRKYVADGFTGVLDWGRGVWTYKNTWYWSSLSAIQDGKQIGFNLGYGFGNTSAASENMVFYEGKGYKMEDVSFGIPQTNKGKDDFMKDWKFTSESGDIDLTFHPLLNRHANTDIGIIASNQNQVFGRFNGQIILPDKTVVKIKDLMGMAEKVRNKW